MAAPTPTRYAQGVSAVSGDQLNTFVQTCASYAQARTVIGTVGMQLAIEGKTAIGDGGQGQFYWNPTALGPDDNGNTLVPNGAAAGAWVRISFGGAVVGGGGSRNQHLAIFNGTTGAAIEDIDYLSLGVTFQPTSYGDVDSITTAFNGDLRQTLLSVKFPVTGATSLGQPATGYEVHPETFPFYTYVFNESGYNESVSGNGGRTGTGIHYAKLDNYGQGDLYFALVEGFVVGTLPGATSFLANSAAQMGVSGTFTAGASGVYLQGEEHDFLDQGFDIACVDFVTNMTRTNSTGALGCFWAAYRVQSLGTHQIDAVMSVQGPIKLGLDFSTAQDATAILVMSAGQGIYFNATNSGANQFPSTTAIGNTYISYVSGTSDLIFVVNGQDVLSLSQSLVIMPNTDISVPFLLTANYANDAAAEAAGIAVGSLYRNGSVVQVRVT